MPAPQFVVVHNRDRDGNPQPNGSEPQNASGNPLNGPEGRDENSRVGAQIENLVNDLLRNFMDVFNGREFLRM